MIAWDFIFFADTNDLETFGGLTDSIVKRWDVWLEWGTCADP
jgi:hypothetical protein